MNKRGKLLVLLLVFSILLSSFSIVNAKDDTALIFENFDDGNTTFSIRQNEKNGEEPVNAVQDGILKLHRENGDGLMHAYKTFPNQKNGELSLTLKIKTDLQNGQLFALSKKTFETVASVELNQNNIIFSCDGKTARAGVLTQGEWYTFRLNLDFDAATAVLYINDVSAASIDGVSADYVSLFEIAIYDNYGYIYADDIVLNKSSVQDDVFTDILQSSAAQDIREVYEKGIMNGVGNGEFSPYTNLTRAQMAQIIVRALKLEDGADVNYSDVSADAWYYDAVCAITAAGIMEGYDDGFFYPDKVLNFEEASKIFACSAEYKGVVAENPVAQTFDILYTGNGLSDSEAVEYDSKVLKFGGEQMIFDNMNLPKKGEYGSDISWATSSNAVSPDGVVTRPAENPESVSLTATITKGAEKRTKTFAVTVMPCNVRWETKEAGTTDSEMLVPQRKNNINIVLDVTPNGFPLNTVMAFTPAETMASSFTQMPVIVRFSEEGIIDAYNLNTYEAINRVEYSKDTKYTIRISIDLSEKSYSVWVKPQGKAEVQIADKFIFRGTAVVANNIGKFYLQRGSYTVDGRALVTRMSIAAPEEVIGSENYLYDKEYSKAGEESDVFNEIRKVKMTTESLELPKVDSNGYNVEWVSSDKSLYNNTGKLIGAQQKNVDFRMTAVSLDGSAAAQALISRKDAISGWAYGYIASAMNMGLVQDIMLKPDFNSKMSVTREYAAVMINRLIKLF